MVPLACYFWRIVRRFYCRPWPLSGASCATITLGTFGWMVWSLLVLIMFLLRCKPSKIVWMMGCFRLGSLIMWLWMNVITLLQTATGASSIILSQRFYWV